MWSGLVEGWGERQFGFLSDRRLFVSCVLCVCVNRGQRGGQGEEHN